jgi:hypothetical protein
MTMPYIIETNERLQHLVSKEMKVHCHLSKGRIEKIFIHKPLPVCSPEQESISCLVDISLEEIEKEGAYHE